MFGGGRRPIRGGRGILRAASRAMRRTRATNGGIQDPCTSSSSSSPPGNASVSHTKKHRSSLTFSATSGSMLNLPVNVTTRWNGGGFPFVNSGSYEDFEWISKEKGEEEEVDCLFGSVPSVHEVEDAVSSLQQVFVGSSYAQLVRDRYERFQENGAVNQRPMVRQVPSSGSDLDWVEPSMQLCYSRTLRPHAYDQVYNAFDLLRTEPSVQRMVVSLSSDKAVWKAVMNNDVVREIRDLYNNGINQDEETPDDTPNENNAAMDFIKWIFDNTMAKAAEVFAKITKVVNHLFNRYNGYGVNKKRKRKNVKFNKRLEEKLMASVLLSIVAMLVVMVSRSCDEF